MATVNLSRYYARLGNFNALGAAIWGAISIHNIRTGHTGWAVFFGIVAVAHFANMIKASKRADELYRIAQSYEQDPPPDVPGSSAL